EDEHLSPGGEIIATTDLPYSARTLAQMIRAHVAPHILDLLIRYAPEDDPRRGLVVTGERGLKAHILRMALVAGDLPWLDAQSDASFQLLESILGNATRSFSIYHITSDGGALNYGKDILTLLRRFKLPATGDGLSDLRDALGRESYERKAE